MTVRLFALSADSQRFHLALDRQLVQGVGLLWSSQTLSKKPRGHAQHKLHMWQAELMSLYSDIFFFFTHSVGFFTPSEEALYTVWRGSAASLGSSLGFLLWKRCNQQPVHRVAASCTKDQRCMINTGRESRQVRWPNEVLHTKPPYSVQDAPIVR